MGPNCWALEQTTVWSSSPQTVDAQRAGERSKAHKLRKRGEQLVTRRKRDDPALYTIDASAFMHPR